MRTNRFRSSVSLTAACAAWVTCGRGWNPWPHTVTWTWLKTCRTWRKDSACLSGWGLLLSRAEQVSPQSRDSMHKWRWCLDSQPNFLSTMMTVHLTFPILTNCSVANLNANHRQKAILGIWFPALLGWPMENHHNSISSPTLPWEYTVMHHSHGFYQGWCRMP